MAWSRRQYIKALGTADSQGQLSFPDPFKLPQFCPIFVRGQRPVDREICRPRFLCWLSAAKSGFCWNPNPEWENAEIQNGKVKNEIDKETN